MCKKNLLLIFCCLSIIFCSCWINVYHQDSNLIAKHVIKDSRIKTNGFYYSGDLFDTVSYTNEQIKNGHFSTITILFFYEDGSVLCIGLANNINNQIHLNTDSAYELPMGFIPDRIFEKHHYMPNVYINTRGNRYLDKLKALKKIFTVKSKHIFYRWGIRHAWGVYDVVDSNTLIIQKYAYEISPFLPFIMTIYFGNMKFKIENDSTLIMDSLQNFFNNGTTKKYAEYNSEFKFYAFPYKPDSSLSFFNKNWKYLRYVEKQKKKKKK